MDAVDWVLKVLVWVYAPIKKELSYIWRYTDNMNDLHEKRAELETLKRQIEGEVEARERKREMIGPLADNLLQDAEEFLANDEWSDFMDENKIKKKDKCCFGILHCNLMYRYRISKRATKRFEITKEKIKKMEDCSSRAVTLPGEPPELGSMPTAHSKSLASRESALNEIMEALKDKEVHRIGIYGMGGIGKTTLIEEVARRAEAEGLFKVVIAEVSQAPDILKMQQQIAERIPLQLRGLESADERAREIHKVLNKLNHKEEDNQMSKKKMGQIVVRQVVVILDNMWKKLDLDRVGIPHDCKIALTTRSEHVCYEMGANKILELLGLTDTEAMGLFLERVGPLADPDDGYKSVTEELVKKCGGLPLAIVALADALRNRDLSDWKHVADQLGRTVLARVGGPMEEKVHPILEWSYNFISNKEKKKFFLLCCLFPLGSSIAIQDLMRCGAGLDLFQYMNSLGEAIEQADSWVAELKSSSLLLEAEDERHVRIHDIIRAASMSIATKGDNIFHVGSFPRWLTKKTFRTYTAISMTSEDNFEALSGFEFPELEMLLLKGSWPFELPDNFFQGMESLKVLVISKLKSQKLTSLITQLKNLQTLYLEHCELSDISAITSLVNLLFLSLRKSKIDELPRELKKLKMLKLLDLTGCSTLQKIPADVIAGLTNLEGLYMMDSFRQWHSDNSESSSKKDELDDNREMASLIELKSLSYLAVLEMHVPKILLLPNNLFFPHLSRFSISIGYESPPCDNIHSKLLFLGEIDASRPLQQFIKCLLKETEHLSLERISGLKNVVDSLDKDGFRNLKCLLVKNCSDMEYIVTENELNEEGGAFPKLEKLTVDGGLKNPFNGMDNLKVIYHGPHSHYSFHHLKRLKLLRLRFLQNFWNDQDMDGNQPFFNEKMKFPSLEELTIKFVDGIVELWNLSNVEEEVPAFPRLINLTLGDLPKLRSIWRSKDIVIYRSFRNLKNLEVEWCPKLKILCPFSVAAALEQLETLKVYHNENMKEIIAKETREMKNNYTEMTIFPKLKNIRLWRLHNLKCLFGGSIKLAFPSLESITCEDLDKMMTFVNSEYPEDSDVLFNDKVALPAIKHIEIYYVDGLKEIWGSHLDAGSFNELESLTVFIDKELTRVFPLNVIKQMRNLKELDLRGFKLAEEFIEHAGFYNDDVENSALLPQLKELRIDSFPLLKQIQWKELALQNLHCLRICNVQGLTSLFPALVGRRLENLEELDVSDCQTMKEIVGWESGGTNTAEVKVVFPHLNILRLDNLLAFRNLGSDNVILEFPSIKKTVLVEFQKSILLDLLQKLHHVKELELEECEFPLELCDLEGRASTILPRLRNLTLSHIYNLQMIPWKIFPIENLHYLQIFYVDELKFLFPASLGSKGFAQLEEICIEGCEDIKQVLAQENIEDTSNNASPITVVLPRVKIIKLYYLQRLRSFSSKNYYTLEFPSLEEVKILKCPLMETFSYGSLNTPRLRKIWIDLSVEREHVDLNAAIKKRREEDTSGKDTETESDTETKSDTEGETSQRIEKETSGEDTKTESTEGETSQWIEEETSWEDTKTESTEGETSQRIEDEMSGEDIKTKSTKRKTNQRIEEETIPKGRETKFIEGETSQGIKEETMCEITGTEFIGETSGEAAKKED